MYTASGGTSGACEVVEHPERQRTHALCAGNAGHVDDGMQPLRRVRAPVAGARWPAILWQAKAWWPAGGTTTRATGASKGRWHDDARDWG